MSSGEESVDEAQNDIEVILEGETENVENLENQAEGNAEENDEGNEEGETKKVVKPKRVIRNPQPKLNEQTIKGPRGLPAIESHFERVKFKGRGHEEQDLNVLMKTYEYWCHRLFPKFPFDDCIARLEKLGTKKTTQTQIKKIRMDLDFDEAETRVSDEGEADTAGFVDTYNDQFDQLLPSSAEFQPIISDEQLERMRQNKEKAERLRQERLRKIREKAQGSLEESSHISTQSSRATSSSFDNAIAGASCSRTSVDDTQEGASSRMGNEEEDIEDILDSINAEGSNKKKRVIESDSEDDTNVDRNPVQVENDRIEERGRRGSSSSEDGNGQEMAENHSNEKGRVLSEEVHADVGIEQDEVTAEDVQGEAEKLQSDESESDNIENILKEINTDNKGVQNKTAKLLVTEDLTNVSKENVGTFNVDNEQMDLGNNQTTQSTDTSEGSAT